MFPDAISPSDPDLDTAPAPVADSGIEWDEDSYFWAWNDWLVHVVYMPPEEDAEVYIVAYPPTGKFEFLSLIPKCLGSDSWLDAPEGTIIADRRPVWDIEDASYWVSLAIERLEEKGELDEDDLHELQRGAREMVKLFFDEDVDLVEAELARRGDRGGTR